MSLIEYRIVDSVGIVVFNRLPAIALDHGLRARIREVLAAGMQDKTRALLVVCRGGEGFGPADVTCGDLGLNSMSLADALQSMQDAGKPVVAALEGAVFGCSLEIALACHYRCSAADACFSFPELRVGLLPSAGGTQRIPRLIGVEASFELFADAPMAASDALRLGLVDRVLAAGAIEDEVLKGIEDLLLASVSRRGNGAVALQANPVPTSIVTAQRNQFAKRYRGQIAPQRLVDCVEAAIALPLTEGLERERELSAECVISPQSRALKQLFLAEAKSGEILDLPPGTVERKIASVAVIGGGTMGAGIAITCIEAGLPVTLLEVDDTALQHGLQTVRNHYQQGVERKRLSEQRMTQSLALLGGATDYGALADVDLVIEAVFEDVNVKRQVFARLDQVCKPGAMLATNTSYQDVDEIAAATTRPGDVVGMHFFSPANVMKLLEVVRGAASAPDALLSAVRLARRLGKIPVLARVCYGFIGNRMLRHYNREVQLCLIEGATPQQIDRAMEKWGMAMGPLAVADLAGLDIGYRARQALKPADRGDPRSYCIADALVEMNRVGRKSGAGYYRYERGARDREIDPAVVEVIEAQSVRHGISRRFFADDEIVERLVLALVNEGARLLEEGIAQRSGDIDVVYCHGYGFPAFRGGPMCYADQLGTEQVRRALRRLRDRFDADHWTPAPLLERLASEGRTFADWSNERENLGPAVSGQAVNKLECSQ